MVTFTKSATISLDETVKLVRDKDGILGTDLNFKISKSNDPSFINYNLK